MPTNGAPLVQSSARRGASEVGGEPGVTKMVFPPGTDTSARTRYSCGWKRDQKGGEFLFEGFQQIT